MLLFCLSLRTSEGSCCCDSECQVYCVGCNRSPIVEPIESRPYSVAVVLLADVVAATVVVLLGAGEVVVVVGGRRR